MKIIISALMALTVLLLPSLEVLAVGPDTDQTFHPNDEVASGASITYYFGPNAPNGGTALSGKLPFSDQGDGAQVSLDFEQPAGTTHGGAASTDGIACDQGSFTNAVQRTTGEGKIEQEGSYTISLDCDSNPETLTIRNDLTIPLRVTFITSFVGGNPVTSSGGVMPNGMPNGGGGGMAGANLPGLAVGGFGLLLLGAYAVLRSRSERSTNR